MRVGPFTIGRSNGNGNGNGKVEAAEEVYPNDRLGDNEIGSTGQSIYGSLVLREYKPELFGRKAIDIYDKMRKSDGKVRAALRAIKAPLLAADWYIEPADDSQEARDQADFIWWCLNNLNRPFDKVLAEILVFFDFGFYVFEKVFEYGEWAPHREGSHTKRVLKWGKFGPRHPKTILEWDYDEHGEVRGVWHQRTIDGIGMDRVFIPEWKLLRFALDEEAGDPEGISLLRSAYKHWFFKEALYKVDAIQKERHGIGIPQVELPPNAGVEDKRLAREMARNLRTNESAYVVKPHGFTVDFLELKGNPVDVLESASHHDLMIASTVLAQFLNLGSTESGSRAVGDVQQDLFVKSTRHASDVVRGEFNRKCIPELIRLNFGPQKRYPQLKVRRIGEEADWRAFSVAIRNLVEPGIVTPDADTEEFVRRIMDLPKASREALDRTIDERRPAKRETDADRKREQEGSRTGGPAE